MKKANPQLIVGLILLAAITLVAIMGSAWAPHEREYSDNFIYVESDQGEEMYVSPVRPMAQVPLGTDQYGHDILSILLHGAKISLSTTLVVAFSRLLVALVIVILFGAGRVKKQPAAKRHQLAGLNAIPQFIILYFILFSINFNSSLSITSLMLLQWALLTAFGVPGLIPSLSESIDELQKREFVTAAQSCGAGSGRILRAHILPHMKEKLLLLFSQETVSVLTLVGQLGIFNIFIGGTRFTPHPPLYHSITYEWAGLVGQYRFKLHPGTWWILLYPLLGFILLLLAFYLTSRGLELLVRKKYHSTSYL